jgi:flagella basal body P-ring formation protein FlgA
MNPENRKEMRRISVVLPSPWVVGVVLGLSVILWAGVAVSQIDADSEVTWRVRILEAATVQGPNVTLGDIAEPVGHMPPETWQILAAQKLWASPVENSRPTSLPRHRLKEQIRQALGPEIEALCLFPGSITIQRNGRVVREAELHQLLVRTLTPQLATFPGETDLSDIRLPSHVFLSHSGQEITIEPAGKLTPGRVSLRISVLDMDQSVVRRISGSMFLNAWATVPAAKDPISKGGVLTPDKIMFVRINLAHTRGELWDGVGGPHRLRRSVGAEQIIYVSDLDEVPLISKGSRVTLVYQRGTVRLETPGEALSDGASGQLVPVRNLQSKTVVRATVQDSRTVLVN